MKKKRKEPIDIALKVTFALAMVMILLAFGASVMMAYAAPNEREERNAGDLRALIEYCYNPPEDEIVLLARMMYGECRGVKDWTLPDGRVIDAEQQKANCCWCAINRVDADGWGDTLAEVVTPGQFHGYSRYNPVWDELYDLARDVLIRWRLESIGVQDVGRTLPPEYTYFCSDGHGHNAFRTTWRHSDPNCRYYDWSLPSPYES
jgi:hypothetical protein